MINIDIQLFESAKVNGEYDIQKMRDSFCQIFNITANDITPEKLNKILSGVYFGSKKRVYDNVTTNNLDNSIKSFMTDVENIISNDKEKHEFVYTDGETYQGIEFSNGDKATELNNSSAVKSSQTIAAGINDEMNSVERRAYKRAFEKINNPNTSTDDKRYIAERLAIYKHAQDLQPGAYLNDAIMFTDEDVRNLDDVGKLATSIGLRKVFTQKSRDVIPQRDRVQTRTNCVRLIMLADGKSLDDVMSDDPKFDEAKRTAGKTLMGYLDTNDLSSLLKKIPKAVEKFDQIKFPDKNATFAEKMAFFHKNLFAMRIAQDIVQLESSNASYKNAINSMSKDEAEAVKRGITTLNVFASYERAMGQLVSKMSMDADSIYNNRCLMPLNIIGNFESNQYLVSVFDGKHPSELDKAKIDEVVRNQALLTPPMDLMGSGNNIELEKTGDNIRNYLTELVFNELDIDVKTQIDAVSNKIGVPSPNLNGIDFSVTKPLEMDYMPLDNNFLNQTNTALKDIGAKGIKNTERHISISNNFAGTDMVIQKNVIKKGVKEFSEKFQMMLELTKELPLVESDVNGNKFDGRDLSDIAMLFKLDGKTRDERKESMRTQYAEMQKAFASGDIEKKGKYLDLLYDSFIKGADLFVNGVKTVEDFNLAASISGLDQCIATKRDENPEWYFKKNSSPEVKDRFYLAKLAINSIASDLLDVKKKNPEFAYRGGLDKAVYGQLGYDMLFSLAKSAQQEAKLGRFDTYTLDIPPRLRESEKANYKDVTTACFVCESMLNLGDFSAVINKDVNMEEVGAGVPKFQTSKLMFLDDKNLYDLAVQNLRKTKEYKNKNKEINDVHVEQMVTSLFNKAMINGDKVVSVAVPKVVNGETQFDLKKIKPNVERVKKSIMDEHSWFRKKFFNWGPFRIKTPDQAKVDDLYERARDNDDKILELANDRYSSEIKKCQTQAIDIVQKTKNSPSYQTYLNMVEANKYKAQMFFEGRLTNDKTENLRTVLNDTMEWEKQNEISTTSKKQEIRLDLSMIKTEEQPNIDDKN